MSVKRVALLGLILIAVSCLFLFWNLRAPVGFILNLRAEKLFTLIFVGASAGASTVIFQTVASNRLLTPGIVGFDALFTFLQTALVLSFGAAGYLMLPAVPKFLVETAVLTFCAVALFGILFRKGADDIVRMILTGVILGTLLRALAGFAQRLMDPSEFAVVQQASVASFNLINDDLLPIAGCALALAFAACVKLARVSLMVAVSTALVGPMVFLGLLAASLACNLPCRSLSNSSAGCCFWFLCFGDPNDRPHLSHSRPQRQSAFAGHQPVDPRSGHRRPDRPQWRREVHFAAQRRRAFETRKRSDSHRRSGSLWPMHSPPRGFSMMNPWPRLTRNSPETSWTDCGK